MGQINIKTLATIMDIPVEAIFKLGTDGYGTPRPYAYGFRYKELAKHFGIKDQSPPGYSNQYFNSFYEEFEKRLMNLTIAGYIVVDPGMLSHVHGYFYRHIKIGHTL